MQYLFVRKTTGKCFLSYNFPKVIKREQCPWLNNFALLALICPFVSAKSLLFMVYFVPVEGQLNDTNGAHRIPFTAQGHS